MDWLNYFHVSFTWIVGGFGEIAVDVVDRFIAHDWEQSAFFVANFLQIITRFWHSADTVSSSARCQVNGKLDLKFNSVYKRKFKISLTVQTFFHIFDRCQNIRHKLWIPLVILLKKKEIELF